MNARPSMITTTTGTVQHDRLDIIFAYANAFGTLNERSEFVPLSERQIIRPDMMFKTICNAVKSKNKKLTIQKRILNFTTFDDILCKNPRVLIIMCHGMLTKDDKCYFCFENEEHPYLIDEFDEERLLECLN